jgi:tryptophan-rich sensory protein
MVTNMASAIRSRKPLFETKSLAALTLFLALPLLVGFAGSQWTDTGAGSWYEAIEKPSWNPPGWAFGLVWSALYLMMGLAAWVVWRVSARLEDAVLPLAAWSVQLGLNLAWTYIFFARENPQAALAEILLLWLAILATILLFARIARVSQLFCSSPTSSGSRSPQQSTPRS